MVNTRLIGKKAEDLAVDYLKKHGYRILQRNYKNKIGEIDLIGLEQGQLVFIEVKARRSINFGLPLESVTLHKQIKLRNVAQVYLSKFGMPKKGCRFDVVSILFTGQGQQIELIKNAF